MTAPLQAPLEVSGYPTEHLLYGDDPLAGIVAVERIGFNGIRLFRRDDEELVFEDAPFHPWLLAERREPWIPLRGVQNVEELAGNHALRFLVEFADWPAFLDAARSAEESGARFHRLRSPIEQYLVRSGRTLFKRMVFEDVQRLQVDIETTGFDPRDPESQVIVVALKFGDAVEEVLAQDEQSGEAGLLVRLTEWLRDLDPDVIEGHNLFNFDLPFLAARAERLGVKLAWGRDG